MSSIDVIDTRTSRLIHGRAVVGRHGCVHWVGRKGQTPWFALMDAEMQVPVDGTFIEGNSYRSRRESELLG